MSTDRPVALQLQHHLVRVGQDIIGFTSHEDL